LTAHCYVVADIFGDTWQYFRHWYVV